MNKRQNRKQERQNEKISTIPQFGTFALYFSGHNGVNPERKFTN